MYCKTVLPTVSGGASFRFALFSDQRRVGQGARRSVHFMGACLTKTLTALVAAAGLCVAGAAWAAPDPATLTAPTPIEGTTGKYMSPFTSDGVTAAWVTKSMQVKATGQVGALAGQYAGQKAMEQVPFVGGFLGKKVGQSAGRAVALQAIGGEAFLRSSTDLSFNSLQDMATFMYVNHSTHAEYKQILEATYAIYPDFKPVYTGLYGK